MIRCNEEGVLVVDREKYNNLQKLWETRHFNNISIHSETVQMVIQKFKFNPHSVDYIYRKLRQHYWKNFDTLEEFENNIKLKIESSTVFKDVIT